MKPTDPRHGTTRGYYVHRGDGENACPSCLRAVARYQKYREVEHYAGRPLLVDRTPTVRRIRALMAIGWPGHAIAARLGHKPAYVSVLLTRTRAIRRPIADQIAALYDELCMTPGPSELTRLRAQREGWPPPLAWDDIDTDPAPAVGTAVDVDDVVVRRILDGDPAPAHTATPAERRAVVAAWPTTARPINDLERLTGWKPQRYAIKEAS